MKGFLTRLFGARTQKGRATRPSIVCTGWMVDVFDGIRMLKGRVVVFMVGLPGSGKSVLAESIASKIGGYVLSSDQIRFQMLDYAITGVDFEPVLEPAVWDEYRTLYNFWMKHSDTKCVILDNCNDTRERRSYFVSEARKYGVVPCAVWLDLPVDLVLERNASRDRSVPADVVNTKMEAFEVPGLDEFDLVFRLVEGYL